jgi:hypothetical protein
MMGKMRVALGKAMSVPRCRLATRVDGLNHGVVFGLRRVVPLCWLVVASVVVADDAQSDGVSTSRTSIVDFDWHYRDEGLYYDLTERIHFPGPIVDHLLSTERKLSGRLGFKLQLDAAAFDEDESLGDWDDGIEVRRARVYTMGSFFFLKPLTFALDLGMTDGSFFVNDVFLWWSEVPFVSSLKLGHF